MLGLIRRLAEGINEAIGHPVAFVLATLQTLIWTAIVLTTHADPHGFWFLYMATAISYITQFTLTLVAVQGKKEARHAAELSERNLEQQTTLLENQQATMMALQAVVLSVKDELSDTTEILEEIDEHFHKSREQVGGVLPVVDPPLDVDEEG